MKPFAINTILVAVDLSETSLPALRYARHFADRYSAKLDVIYSDPIAYPLDYAGPVQAYYAAASPEHAASLRGEVEKHAAAALRGRPYELLLREGQAVPAILAAAKERKADLIVMGSHLRHGWRRAILGSVSEGVLHGANVPVLVAAADNEDRPAAVPAVTKIVCPVNFTDAAREAAFAAAHLAKTFDAHLTLIHVIEPDSATGVEQDEEKIRQWIDADLQKICSYVQVVERGGAAERVLDYTEDFHADLMVVGAQHRFFRDTTVIGTTTERLIRFAPCPVFVVPREASSSRLKKEAVEEGVLA